MGLRVAVVGATGTVGREMLTILEERLFPADEVIALASRRSVGKEVSYGDKTLKCKDLETIRFLRRRFGVDERGRRGLEGMVAEDWRDRRRRHRQFERLAHGPARAADRAGSESDAVAGYDKLNIIANPNCSTAQLVVALKPLHDRAKIKRVVVATYQSVSGAGKEAMDELWNQTKKLYVGDEIVPENFRSRSPST
jgi:aspartate-semialdehyde dehydrogenase